MPFDIVEENFYRAAEKMDREGHTIVNPLLIPASRKKPAEKTPEWSDYMRAYIKALCDCDAIFMIYGWENSKGARIEFNLAVDLGLKVIYEKL